MKHTGPARVFESEEQATAAIRGKDQKGDVLVIRYEGRRAVPACGKCSDLPPRWPGWGLPLLWRHNRRAFFGSVARRVHRAHLAGSCGGRADRAHPRGRYDRNRHSCESAERGRLRRGARTAAEEWSPVLSSTKSAFLDRAREFVTSGPKRQSCVPENA